MHLVSSLDPSGPRSTQHFIVLHFKDISDLIELPKTYDDLQMVASRLYHLDERQFDLETDELNICKGVPVRIFREVWNGAAKLLGNIQVVVSDRTIVAGATKPAKKEGHKPTQVSSEVPEERTSSRPLSSHQRPSQVVSLGQDDSASLPTMPGADASEKLKKFQPGHPVASGSQPTRPPAEPPVSLPPGSAGLGPGLALTPGNAPNREGPNEVGPGVADDASDISFDPSSLDRTQEWLDGVQLELDDSTTPKADGLNKYIGVGLGSGPDASTEAVSSTYPGLGSAPTRLSVTDLIDQASFPNLPNSPPGYTSGPGYPQLAHEPMRLYDPSDPSTWPTVPGPFRGPSPTPYEPNIPEPPRRRNVWQVITGKKKEPTSSNRPVTLDHYPPSFHPDAYSGIPEI